VQTRAIILAGGLGTRLAVVGAGLAFALDAAIADAVAALE